MMLSKKKQKQIQTQSADSDSNSESEDGDQGWEEEGDNDDDNEMVEKSDDDDDVNEDSSEDDDDDGDDDDNEKESTTEDIHNSQEKLGGMAESTSKTNKETSRSEKKGKHDQQMLDIRNEISNLSFEELQKLKNKMGLKLFNQIYYGKEPKKPKEIPKRANRNRPQEVSSKKPVKRRFAAKSKLESRVRDPRFDERTGEFDAEQFKTSYSFIDDIKTREKSKLEKLLSREKNPEKRRKISYLLNRINQQEDSKKKKDNTMELKRKIKKAERKDVVQGQTPFYLKKSDMKKLELAEKFRELKKSGKLEKFMSKKRKKLAQKDRKKMPVV